MACSEGGCEFFNLVLPGYTRSRNTVVVPLTDNIILLEVLTVGDKLNTGLVWFVVRWKSSTIYYSGLKAQTKQYLLTRYATKLKWSANR